MRLNFRLKGYVSHWSLWTVRYGNDCTTTMLLKVLCQRNFVADFIQLKLSFIQKRKSLLFEPPFGRLRGNVRTSSIARWKARVRLPTRLSYVSQKQDFWLLITTLANVAKSNVLFFAAQYIKLWAMQDLARYFVSVVKFERRLRSSLIAIPHFMPSWALCGLVTLSWPRFLTPTSRSRLLVHIIMYAKFFLLSSFLELYKDGLNGRQDSATVMLHVVSSLENCIIMTMFDHMQPHHAVEIKR